MKNTSAAPLFHHHPLLPGSTRHGTHRYYLKGFERFWLKTNLYEIPLARCVLRSTCLYHVGSSKRGELLVTSPSCLLPKIHSPTSISMLISTELDATLIQQRKNICFNSEAISARKSCPFSLLLHYLLLPKKVSFSKSMLSGAKGKTSELITTMSPLSGEQAISM